MRFTRIWTRLALVILFSLTPRSPIFQAEAPFAIGVTPGVELPLGPISSSGRTLFTTGGGASVSVEYTLPFAPILFAQGLVGYRLLPTTVQTNLNLVSFGAGAGVRLDLLPRLEAQLSMTGGFSLGTYRSAAPGGAPFVNAEIRLYSFTNSFALGLAQPTATSSVPTMGSECSWERVSDRRSDLAARRSRCPR